jgi:hypothetical protein
MLRPLLALYRQGFLQVLDRLVERERYAAFGLGDIDSNLARGIEKTVKREEGGSRTSRGAQRMEEGLETPCRCGNVSRVR